MMNDDRKETCFRYGYNGDLKEWWIVTLFILGTIALGLLIALPFVVLNDIGGTDDHHTGYVTAVEQRDNVTWDSTVVYFKTSGESTQEDTYCVNDADTRTRLENYARSRKAVTIHYRNGFWFWRSDCNGGESIIIDVVEAAVAEAP